MTTHFKFFQNSAFILLPLTLFSFLLVSGCGSETNTSDNDDPGDIGTASVTLSWESPTTNTDQSCLADLGGYKVYYGTSSGSYSNVETIDINNISCADTGNPTACGNIQACTYTINGLSKRQWYFSTAAYDVNSIDSALSGEVTTIVN